MDYYDLYEKRLNRYGDSYKTRMQGKREENFMRQLERSVYKVEFAHEQAKHVGELRPNKQNETKNLQWLLVPVDVKFKNGTILGLTTVKGETHKWLIYWFEEMQASGYNRYAVLKLTHQLSIINPKTKKVVITDWAYFYGQEDNMLKNEIKSRSRSHTLYLENLKLSFFVMPEHDEIERDFYLEVTTAGGKIEPFRVTGYDKLSTPGVEYVSVDPVYQYDLSPNPPKPTNPTQDDKDDFFWLDGGIE